MDKSQQISKIREIAKKIINTSKSSLIVHLRFLDTAINKLNYEEFEEYLSVDGKTIKYNPKYILSLYMKQKNLVTRAYLHMILHCTFMHFYVGPHIDRNVWNVACDIAVENIIDELASTEDYLIIDDDSEKQRIMNMIKENVDRLTAEKIYRFLLDSDIPEEEMAKMFAIFGMDQHECWYDMSHSPQQLPKLDDKDDSKPGLPDYQEDNDKSSETDENSEKQDENQQDSNSNQNESGDTKENQSEDQQTEYIDEEDEGNQQIDKNMQDLLDEWEEISKQMDLDLETFSKERGSRLGDLIVNLKNVTREKYDYTSFLKKFASMGEKMMIDEDEFDYIYYTYGLTVYNNMPLVEPLEYKETNVVKEFVIAIDTSFSVHGDEVNAFLRKTYNILKATESFSNQINLHIIQCDVKVQHDEKITSQAQLDKYMSDMLLFGFGGTDFRPVFEYVDELISKKEFTNLKGLIYFTDGFGEFPKRAPSYKTAFAFVNDDPLFDPIVPPWAIKLILDPEDIKEDK